MSRKQTVCISKIKDADLLRGNREADQSLCLCLCKLLVFSILILQCIYYLHPNFPDSSHLLCLYRPVCVGPVQNNNCYFNDFNVYHFIFYSRFILEVSDHQDIGSIGAVIGRNTIFLILTWVMIFLCLLRGPQSIAKVYLHFSCWI